MSGLPASERATSCGCNVTAAAGRQEIGPGAAGARSSQRRYASNAERQAAYRERCRQQWAERLASKALPALPVLPAMPGTARWRAAVGQAIGLLAQVTHEMQTYHDQRTERWQEDERGEAFCERLEALEEALDLLKDDLA